MNEPTPAHFQGVAYYVFWRDEPDRIDGPFDRLDAIPADTHAAWKRDEARPAWIVSDYGFTTTARQWREDWSFGQPPERRTR